MPLASLAFVLSTFVVPGASGSAPAPPTPSSIMAAVATPEVCSASVVEGVDQQRRTAGQATTVTQYPHTFGIGGALGGGFGSNRMSVGGAFRYWIGDYVGVDFKANWTRYNYTGTPQSVAQVSPSVIFMFTRQHGGAIDVRPYAGAGPSYLRLPGLVTTSATVQSGTAMQEFGGAEITFRDMRQIALSAEVVHNGLPGAFATNNLRSGTFFAVEFHYYLR